MCDGECSPVIDISESGKPVMTCPKCQSVLGLAREGTADVDVTSRPRQPELRKDEPVQRPAPLRLAQEAWPVAPQVMLKPPTAQPLTGMDDLVGAARVRLGVIEGELQRLAALQREHRKLTAMVAAADAADETDPVQTPLDPSVDRHPLDLAAE